MQCLGSLRNGLQRFPISQAIRLASTTTPAGKRQVSFEKVGNEDFLPLMNCFVNGFGTTEPMVKTHVDTEPHSFFRVPCSVSVRFEMDYKGKRQVSFEKVGNEDFLPLMNCFVNGFGTTEPMVKVLKLSYEDLCHASTYIVGNAVKSGISLKLVDKERNNKIVGFRCNSIHSIVPNSERTSPVTIDMDFVSENLKKMLTIIGMCRDITMDYGKKAGWKSWACTDAMFIDPEYRNNGQKLSKDLLHKFSTNEDLMAMGVDGYIGECSNARSLKVCMTYGGKPLQSVPESVYNELGIPADFRFTPVLIDYKEEQATERSATE